MIRTLAFILAGSSCSVSPQVPMARVAMNQFPHNGFRAAALPVACKAILPGDCSGEITRAVDIQIRSQLEFAGLTIVDSERLFAAARQRVETTRERETAATFSHTKTTAQLVGNAFVELSIRDRLNLLDQLGLDGVLRVTLSSSQGDRSYRFIHRVTLAMVDKTDKILWTSRCQVTSGDNYGTARAIETAAECAARAALCQRRHR